jgi:hypothetical protein
VAARKQRWSALAAIVVEAQSGWGRGLRTHLPPYEPRAQAVNRPRHAWKSLSAASTEATRGAGNKVQPPPMATGWLQLARVLLPPCGPEWVSAHRGRWARRGFHDVGDREDEGALTRTHMVVWPCGGWEAEPKAPRASDTYVCATPGARSTSWAHAEVTEAKKRCMRGGGEWAEVNGPNRRIG